MTGLGFYLVKMLICSGLLFGYYRMALYNERFHQWNRFYLLAAMAISVVAPLITIPWLAQHPQDGMVTHLLVALPWNVELRKPSTPEFWTLSTVVTVGIASVSVALMVKLMLGMAAIYKIYSGGIKTKIEAVDVVVTMNKAAPFSFFKWLFWRADIEPQSPTGQRMLRHELTHMAEKHSWDKLFCELLLVVFWMNPFFWLVRKELDAIHEFLADRKAIGRADGSAFATMILQAAHALPTLPVTNPFFHSQLKRRLYMITNSKQPQYAYLRRIIGLAAMVIATLSVAFSVEKAQAQTPKKTPIPTKATKKMVLQKADTLFWITDAALAQLDTSKSTGLRVSLSPDSPKYLMQEVVLEKHSVVEEPSKTPQLAETLQDALRENPLYLYAGLEITAAQAKQIDPKKIAAINVYKGSQAVKRYGAKAQNGVVEIIPIISSVLEKPVGPSKVIELKGLAEGKKQPLVIVDGVKTNMKALEGLLPNQISSIDVIKGEKASAWGADGANGVLVIKTTRNEPGGLEKRKLEERPILAPNEQYSKIFSKAEQMPEFPGGKDAWRRYLERSLRYPDEAQTKGTAGVATIEFIVDTEGNISNLKIVKDPGDGLGQEALRILKTGPKWKPGEQNGRKVVAKVLQDVTFMLE